MLFVFVCRSKCSCHQLTLQATGCTPGGQINPNAGYNYKRLDECLPTGSVFHTHFSVLRSNWPRCWPIKKMIHQHDPHAFALSPSGCTSVTSGAAVILRCAITAWCSTASKCACSCLRPRTRAGASVALMTWPKALLSASMQVLNKLIWIPCIVIFFIMLSNMSYGSSEIKALSSNPKTVREDVSVWIAF